MTIITGGCLEVMKTFPDNHFSAIVTDPPYGLSFMNKEWDHDIPGIEFWVRCLKILKPGGFLLSFGGTRTVHRLTCAIEDAGFDIRDLLMWIYGSGFPKSHNHFGIPGYGTALKPAFEPIIMAMKPLEGTYKQNAEKWGQAGINIGGCRIETTEKLQGSTNRNDFRSGNFGKGHKPNPGDIADYAPSAKGRWPSNILFDEEGAKMLDEQSGILTSGQHKGYLEGESVNEVYGKRALKNINAFASSRGGASRFFYCAKASSSERNEGLEELPLRYAELTTRLGNDPCKGKHNSPRKNSHPTVKPLKLMEYLIELVMPPSNGILLDPFAGSGTTILAAKRLGFDAIGVEKQPEYAEIARKRLESYERKQAQMPVQLDLLQNISL